jgi:hypothetical protein
MNINLQDENVRENYMRHLKDNKQFNIYKNAENPGNFAEDLVNEIKGGNKNGTTRSN